MKKKLIILFLSLCIVGPALHATEKKQAQYRTIEVNDAPFAMPAIHEYIYPERNFPITKYGAKADGKTICTKAIARAIANCNKAGGGHVVVPAGDWITGPIHFMSNVDLHLEEGARLIFTDNPADYLPAVFTTWEGVECYNYSPLVYAYDCENIKISGKGQLAPRMEKWREWFARPAAHIEATRHLYDWCSYCTPVEVRRLTDLPESNMRPHLIQLNRCRNVVLEDFSIRESPFWTVHIYMCNEGIARRLNVYAHGHNNDGIDIDMTSNFLVEDCTFDQGDDAVVIKAGRNQDAWRLNSPTRNIVIRNCTVVDGHVLLGIGSEMSGGVENVWMHDCKCLGNIKEIFYVKTNHRRGGFVRNIWLENAHVRFARRMAAIDTDVVYQWKNFPDRDTVYTEISGLHIHNVQCDSVWAGFDFNGDPHRPIRDIDLQDLTIGKVRDYLIDIHNAEDVKLERIHFE